MVFTIITVNFFSLAFLRYNIELTKQLNPDIKHNWLIIDNETSDMDNSNIKSLENLQSDTVSVSVIPGDSKSKYVNKSGGEHHAKALHIGLDYLSLKGVNLVLDPDFYILKKHWIKEVLGQMKENNLSFMGVPWNPKWYRKLRYFPTIHCLFINFDKVVKSDINFYPGKLKDEKMYISNYFLSLLNRKEENQKIKSSAEMSNFSKGINKKTCKIGKIITNQFSRLFVRTSLDTGWGLYKKFYKNPKYRWHAFTPVFNPKKEYPLKCFVNFNLFLDKILPDRISLTPKKNSFVSLPDDTLTSLLKDKKFYSELFLHNNSVWGKHFRNQRVNASPEYKSIKHEVGLIVDFANKQKIF